MAHSLGYTPPTPPDTAAQDELDDLVRALHDSGLTRAFAGAVRSYPRLLHQLLDAVDPDVVRSVIALGAALRDPDPVGSARLADGVRRARSEATAAAADPDGPVGWWRRLRDPDTRRGLSAALAALAALGAALAPDDVEPSDRGPLS